jgi:hypothetical protein
VAVRLLYPGAPHRTGVNIHLGCLTFAFVV